MDYGGFEATYKLLNYSPPNECSAKPCSEFCSYVELYDGGSANSPSLGRFCQGSPRNESQFSTGNQMFVMFHPGLIVDRGFEANYSESSPGSTPSPLTTETTLTSRSKETSASKKSLPPNAVAGIVVGGLIFVPFIVIRVYYYCRHVKKEGRTYPIPYEDTKENISGSPPNT
ncbi:Bone morphogenetic protein 1 [Stylophora pistillata]|uniref:Bone morphogenetic protein 1 n=1 Tax=Stylophora pistillata TaxID=50429 RepID=A0A2B4SZN9_STYPI|nr:Bone morphogenetic protein 1 [Stylophora pistillata]